MSAPSGHWCTLRRQRQTYGPTCTALESAMDGTRVAHEVCACPRMAGEELIGEHVPFQPVTAGAGRDEVAREMRPAASHRMDVVQRRGVRSERRRAVDAAASTFTECSASECALAVPCRQPLGGAHQARGTIPARQRISSETTSWHFPSLEKQTPRLGPEPGGVSVVRETMELAPQVGCGARRSASRVRRAVIGLRVARQREVRRSPSISL